jgi:hypothetical protein
MLIKCKSGDYAVAECCRMLPLSALALVTTSTCTLAAPNGEPSARMPPASWWPAWLPSSRLSLLLLPWILSLQHIWIIQSSSKWCVA